MVIEHNVAILAEFEANEGMKMFEPVEGKQRCVRDAETGIEMWLSAGADYSQLVNVRLSDRREFSFGILIEPKYPERPFAGPSLSYPMIKVLMGDLKSAADFHGSSFEQNTRFVRVLLAGLSKMNELWPLSRSPFFYGDSSKYKGREKLFNFQLPSDDEISRL